MILLGKIRARVDLHLHSTRSDGKLSPLELAKLLVTGTKAPRRVMALTDHNVPTSSTDVEAIKSEFDRQIEVVSGVEIEAFRGDPLKMEDCLHFLGYGVKANGELATRLAKVLATRRQCCSTFISVLRDHGIIIDLEEVEKSARGEVPKASIDFGMAAIKNPRNRSVLARFGKTFDQQNDAIFAILAPHIPRAYVLTPDEVLDLINKDGGSAVLAHPSTGLFNLVTDRFSDFRKNLRYLMDRGLKGVECLHPSHSFRAVVGLSLAAGYYGLARTAGTDFHGNNDDYMVSYYKHHGGRIRFPLAGWTINSRAWKLVERFAV